MLTGWVGGIYDETNKSYSYAEIDEEGSQTKLGDVDVAYYCLYDEEMADGHVQEDKWFKTWRPEDAYDEERMTTNSGIGSTAMVRRMYRLRMTTTVILLATAISTA